MPWLPSLVPECRYVHLAGRGRPGYWMWPRPHPAQHHLHPCMRAWRPWCPPKTWCSSQQVHCSQGWPSPPSAGRPTAPSANRGAYLMSSLDFSISASASADRCGTVPPQAVPRAGPRDLLAGVGHASRSGAGGLRRRRSHAGHNAGSVDFRRPDIRPANDRTVPAEVGWPRPPLRARGRLEIRCVCTRQRISRGTVVASPRSGYAAISVRAYLAA